MNARFQVSAILATLGAALLAPGGAPAQQADCRQRTLPVNVVYRDGLRVGGFAPQDFRGTLRGKPVEIVSLQQDSRPRRIVILLDASGTMVQPARNWAWARAMAGYFAAVAPARSSLGQIVFSGQVNQKVDLTTDHKGFVEALTSLPQKGKDLPGRTRGTALWDAILEGLAMLGQPQPGDAIFVIAGAGDSSGRAKGRQVEAKLAAAGVRLFAAVVSDNFTEIYQTKEFTTVKELGAVVKTTGGETIYISPEAYSPDPPTEANEPERTEVFEKTRRLAQLMDSFYQMTILLPAEPDKAREWKLEIAPSSKFKRRDYQLIYPRKLAPCAASSKK
jgi:hypothetical protein